MPSTFLRGSGSRDAKHLPARFRLAFSSSTIDLRSSSAISARMFTTARADGVHFEVQDFRHNVNGSEHGFARGIFSQPRHWLRGRAINAMLARMQHATAQATGCLHGRWSGQLPVLWPQTSASDSCLDGYRGGLFRRPAFQRMLPSYRSAQQVRSSSTGHWAARLHKERQEEAI